MIRIPHALRVLLCVLLLAGSTGCRREVEPPQELLVPADSTTIPALLGLMNERLSLMHDVARWKWNAKKPIEDLTREKELLDAVGAQGAAKGLDRGEVRWFFAAQIEAAKQIQQADFDRWTAEKAGPFAMEKDLSALRAELDALNEKLLEALLAAKPIPDVISEQYLNAEGVTAVVRATALSPLRENRK